MRLAMAVCAWLVSFALTSRAESEAAAPDRLRTSSASASAETRPSAGTEKIEDEAKKRAAMEVGAYNDDQHVTVFTPSVAVGIDNVDGASLRGTYLVDVVSAASVDIVTTASPRWQETRHAGSLYGQFKPKDFGVGMGGSVSSEPDYLSYGGFLTAIQDFDEKNWTLQLGAGLARDTIGRCNGRHDPCTPFSVFSRDVWRGSFNGGVNVVMDRMSVLSVTGDVVLESGDQSKVYRAIPLFDPATAATLKKGESIDSVQAKRRSLGGNATPFPPIAGIVSDTSLEALPLSRQRYALTGRYSRRFGASTLRLSERVYKDSWGLLASSTDLRWIFDLGKRFAVWPHARFHVQNGANFWKLAYVSYPGQWNIPTYRTGDRELGPLFTATGGAGVRFYLGSNADPEAWALQLSGDLMYTSFQDALYVTSRVATLGALGFEGSF